MARERMVTRTITKVEVNCLCLDIETAEPMNKSFIVPVGLKNQEAQLRYIKKHNDTDTLKVVSIVDIHETEQLYGMTELEFISLAKPINKD